MSATTNQQAPSEIFIQVCATSPSKSNEIKPGTPVGSILYDTKSKIITEQKWTTKLNRIITSDMTVREFAILIGKTNGLGNTDTHGRDLTLWVASSNKYVTSGSSYKGSDIKKLSEVFKSCGGGGALVLDVTRRTAKVNITFVLGDHAAVNLTGHYVFATDNFGTIMKYVNCIREVDLTQYNIYNAFDGNPVIHSDSLVYMCDNGDYDFVCTRKT